MAERIEVFANCIAVNAGVAGLELSEGFNLELTANGQENFYLKVKLPMDIRHRYKLGEKVKVSIVTIEPKN